MPSYIVSLKNIYRILTTMDYPIYSDPVFPRKELKGLTLIRFWKQVLPYSWRNTASGKIIWRTEGSTNRLHSELCNRKESFKYYENYINEILDLINKEGLETQIELFSSFLNEHNYNKNVFQNKIKTFLKMTAIDDELFSESAQNWILDFLPLYNSSEIDKPFLDAWFLTMLTIHAIAGNEMNNERMIRFRHDLSTSPSIMWNAHQTKKESGKQYELLTNRSSLLFLQPKSSDEFFGRQSQLYDLKDMVANGKKYLISGVGGIGKTELLRVFLDSDVIQKYKKRVAVVQFEDSLTESFLHSFRNLNSLKEEDICNEVSYLLNEIAPEKTILLIDNLDVNALDEKEEKLLSELKCCVLATSRQTQLQGFETYKLNDLDDASSSLIFRSNYVKILDFQEKKELTEIIHNNSLHHPLLLIHLGKKARKKHLSIQQIDSDLKESKNEGTGNIIYAETFKKMYSIDKCSSSEKLVLQLIASLPLQAYSLDNLVQLAGEKIIEKDLLYSLADEGWLQVNGNLWSMHPVIAENVASYNIEEKKFSDIWNIGEKRIRLILNELSKGETLESLRKRNNITGISQSDFLLQMRMLFSLLSHIHEKVSNKLLLIGEYALYFLTNFGEAGVRTEKVLEKMYLDCPNRNAETNLWMFLIRAEYWTNINYEEINAVVDEQLKHQTVSDWLLYSSYYTLIAAYQAAEGDVNVMNQKLKQALALQVPASVKDMFHAHLYVMASTNYALQLNVDGVIDSADNLKNIVDTNPERYDTLLVEAQTYVAYTLAAVGRSNEAIQRLNNISANLKKIKNPEIIAIYLQAKGSAESAEGKQEEALETYQELIKIMEIQYGKGSLNWCVSVFYYGLTLYRMKRYTEASEAYQTEIAYMRKNNPDSVQLMPMMNNLAVVYLDLDETEKAYKLLMEAFPIAEEMGGIGLAECQWNLSRVMRTRNNTKEELTLLKQCMPVFEEYYGKKNPKTVRCAERLNELKNVMGIKKI